MSAEFDLIRKYFTRPTPTAVLGIGDDAALVHVPSGQELAISADMLVAGTHFFPDAPADAIGWKSLAVNISDMAAMGAKARWATLAIAIPSLDANWLEGFAKGFFECAERFGVELIGGDTTRGPLTVSIQIMGEAPAGSALRRSDAQVGDDIWVSGPLGDAALALAALQDRFALSPDELDRCLPALERPMPRADFGMALRGIATSALDISDGLLADLGHILKASSVGAEIYIDNIPAGPVLQPYRLEIIAQQMLLAGGDDYELCFTAPIKHRNRILGAATACGLSPAIIGRITAGNECMVFDTDGRPIKLQKRGYDHFSAN